MITESKLEALGFNKIVWKGGTWKGAIEYWLPLPKPEMDCLSVKFNESENELGPLAYLGLRSTSVLLPHIKFISQLIQLYELLAGHSFEVSDGGE